MKPTKKQIVDAVGELGMLKYFPSDDAARKGVMRLLERKVRTSDELGWLVRTMIEEVGEWHGPKELLGVLCSRFSPAEGEDVDCLVTPGFTPDALEMRSLAEHEQFKLVGAGASMELLPLPEIEAKWETLPAEGPQPARKPVKITERSEAEINELLKKMGAV